MIIWRTCLFLFCLNSYVGFSCPKDVTKSYYTFVKRGPEELSNLSIKNFSAFRFSAKKPESKIWEEVPVQIDERNEFNEIVLSEGMPFTKHSGTGLVNERSDFILDGKTFGDDFSSSDIPEFIATHALRSWKLSFCNEQINNGYILLVYKHSSTSATPFSPNVHFDQKNNLLETENYKYIFRSDHPALLGQVVIKTKGGELPLFKGSRFKLMLQTPWYLPDFSLADVDFISQIESWQIGPIRSVIAVGVKYKSFLSLFDLHLFSELVFYNQSFSVPTVIEFPFDGPRFLKAGSGIFYGVDINDYSKWKLNSNIALLPDLSPQEIYEKYPKASSYDLFFAEGNHENQSHISFKALVNVDKKAKGFVPPPFLIHKDMAASTSSYLKNRPWLSQNVNDLSIFIDFSQVKKGSYDFGLDLFLSLDEKGNIEKPFIPEPTWEEFFVTKKII